TLKGSNRKKFVNQLKTNVTRALKPLEGFHPLRLSEVFGPLRSGCRRRCAPRCR
ncbi:hypothetical protein, partial [Microbacterium oxydans]|uniref:hypothetical protein n=1 Tax=Microbacterium oxydans TaxID=82380 RepID=UPI003D9EA3FA